MNYRPFIFSPFYEQALNLAYKDLINMQKSAVYFSSKTNNRKCTDQYMPYRIDIVLDNKCNLDCIGCIRTHITKEDTIVDYLNFIESVLNNCNTYSNQIHFTGGEPLLKLDSIKEIVHNIKHKLPISIYTNLTILQDEIINFLKDRKIEIHTSLDGLKKENDLIRGSGTFDIIINNIKKLKKENIPVRIVTTTLKNENINSINENFIDLLWSLEIETWRLNIDYYGINIKSKEIIEITMFLYRSAIEKGISVEGTWLYPFYNLISNNKKGFCPAIKGETVAILPDGKISMCPYSNTILGNSLEDWKIISERYNSVKKNVSESPKCDECIIKDYCQTQCLITSAENNNELFKWYCEIYRGLTVKLLNYHMDNGI